MDKNTGTQNSKSTLIALSLLSAIFFVSSISLFLMKQAEAQKRAVLEKRVDELNYEKTKLTRDLEETTVLKKDLEIKLGNFEERAKLLEVQLEDEKRAKDSAFAQIETEKRETKKLVDELMRIKDEKEKLSLQIVNMENESSNLKTQLTSVQQAKEVLENKLKDILAKKEVELEKIVVKPENTLPAQPVAATTSESVSVPENNPAGAPEAKGEVLVVNKKFDFVVVNLGEENGLSSGMTLTVYRAAKMLAVVQVEKVHANMAAAKMLPEWKDADIREGDKVAVVK